jgi:ankyrin repeat protein
MNASHLGHVDTVRLLLEHHTAAAGGAATCTIINDQTKLGNTALSIASFHGHFHVDCLLLHHGADAWIANHQGSLPVDVAKGEMQTH